MADTGCVRVAQLSQDGAGGALTMTSVLAMAHELVLAQIRAGHLTRDVMHQFLYETHTHLLALQVQEDRRRGSPPSGQAAMPAALPWKKSLTKHAVVCLECGVSFKQLSIRHLRRHNLDKRAYCAKYGIPRRQPLAAKSLTARRKHLVQQHRLWEKAPMYLKAQTRAAATAAQTTTPRRTRRRPPAGP